jgi:hypothetical protein
VQDYQYLEWAKGTKTAVNPSLIVALYGISHLDNDDSALFVAAFSDLSASGTEEGGCGGCGGG